MTDELLESTKRQRDDIKKDLLVILRIIGDNGLNAKGQKKLTAQMDKYMEIDKLIALHEIDQKKKEMG